MRRYWTNLSILAVLAMVIAALVLPVIANGNRICFAPGAVRAAVFMHPDRIEIYAIDNQDRGELQFALSQTELAALPAYPSPSLLLGASDVHIHVEMWRTTGGQYRVLAGPDGENKVHECIFDGSSARVRTFMDQGEAAADDHAESNPPSAASTSIPTGAAPTDSAATAAPPTSAPPTPVSTREVTFGG